MSSALHTIRYPSGASEFRSIEKQPNVGDVLTCNGDNWVVEEVHENVVTLRHQVLLQPPAETASHRSFGAVDS